MSSSHPPASARALFRQSKQLAAASAAPSGTSTSPAARIHHPFAAYDAHARLKCTLCDTPITSAAAWKPHLASPQHKAAIASRQQRAATNPAVKRTVAEAGGEQGGPVAKVAKTSVAASPVAGARVSGGAAAAAALAAYASSEDEEEGANGDQDSDEEGGGALPAGFFDNDDDGDEGSDSDSDSDPPSAVQPTAQMDDADDADLLAYDIPDDSIGALTSPANLAAAILDAQVDDDDDAVDAVDPGANGQSHQPQAQPADAHDVDDPDSALFAGLIADRADAETRTQAELVERLRRLRTQRGQFVGGDVDDQSGSDSSEDGAEQENQQSGRPSGADADDDEDDESEEEEEDWSWRVRGMQGAKR